MFFKLYSDSFNQISKGYAKGLFVVGLLLIGFGTLVWLFKEVLALIAAAIFVVVGAGCCFNAVRIFFSTWKSGKSEDDGRSANVKIHIEQDMNL
jgi:sugar phosphate permease